MNPNLPEGEETEILERLRGDAIGSTLYSERFVISTLLKLREMEEPLENDEKFETDLEGLWDMTIELDVVLKLIELDVYEIFTQSIVKYENDSRLIEILVGIIGNMCTVSEKALEELCKNEANVDVILQLIACGDSCVLIQLMRLITMVYGKVESARIWNRRIMAYSDFMQNFCFILHNSNNTTLLSNTLEALNAALAKCAIMEESKSDDHVSEAEENSSLLKKNVSFNLVTCTIEAFQTIHSKEIQESSHHDEFADIESVSEALKKAFTVFLNIHDIILNYGPQVYNEELESALSTCFNTMLRTISTPNFVSPANTDYLQDVLECLLPMYLTRKALHNEDTVFLLISLFKILKNNIDAFSKGPTASTNDFEADDLELNEIFKELYELIKELLRVLLKNCKEKSLKNIFRRCEPESAMQVFKAYGLKINNYDPDHIDTYCAELKTSFLDHKQDS